MATTVDQLINNAGARADSLAVAASGMVDKAASAIQPLRPTEPQAPVLNQGDQATAQAPWQQN